MKALCLTLAILTSIPDSTGTDFTSAVLILTGASSPEELDEETLQHFQTLEDHPIDINSAGRSRLLGSGLLTTYQTASLLEYRSRSGAILSLTELSLIDGFSTRIAEALSHFITLKASGSPGHTGKKSASHTLTVKGGVKSGGNTVEWSGGGKYGFTFADRLELNWAGRVTYSDKQMGPGTISAACYGKRCLGKVVLGHFGARFGQGLALWSGFSMTGVSSAAAMKKSGTGLSATSSYSPVFCGIASDWNFGKWDVSAAWAFPRTPILAASRTFTRATVGLTATAGIVSADWKVGIRDFNFFGEAAWDGAPAVLSGIWWVPEYGTALCAVLRYYHPDFTGEHSGSLRSSTNVRDEAGASIGYDGKILNITGDICIHPEKGGGQLKGLIVLHPEFPLAGGALKPSLRLSSRYRNPDTYRWRNDLRTDIAYDYGNASFSIRLNALKCRSVSWLTYAEAGYRREKWQAYGRWTLFRVDNWEDRIYVYERDAPGNFNVPAYYGRGWGLSLYAGYKPDRRHSLWLRLSALQYREKESKMEAKLQYRLSL